MTKILITPSLDSGKYIFTTNKNGHHSRLMTNSRLWSLLKVCGKQNATLEWLDNQYGDGLFINMEDCRND